MNRFMQAPAAFVLAFFICFSATADQTDEKLPSLFDQLLVTDDPRSLSLIESQIWELWLQHPNPDVERLMLLGTQSMNAQAVSGAMLIFTQVIEKYPDYAEAWNKRATLHYILGDLEASIADINETLALEPKHFGALSGLGMVYIQQEDLVKAKKAFEDLIAVHPNSPNAKGNLEVVIQSLELNVI